MGTNQLTASSMIVIGKNMICQTKDFNEKL